MSLPIEIYNDYDDPEALIQTHEKLFFEAIHGEKKEEILHGLIHYFICNYFETDIREEIVKLLYDF